MGVHHTPADKQKGREYYGSQWQDTPLEQMPLREVALPEAVGTDGAYEARIDTIYIPWKPHEIKTIVTDLTNIEKCPKKWYKNIVSVQKTQ